LSSFFENKATYFSTSVLVALSVLFFAEYNSNIFPKTAHAQDNNAYSLQTLALPSIYDTQEAYGGGDVRIIDTQVVSSEANPFLGEETVSASDNISWHTVRSGETLHAIALMYGVSESTILWANNLSSTKDIREGTTLLILPISGVQHVVKKGDTLASIAKIYGGDTEEIIRYNNLENESLVLGTTLVIPGGEKPKENKKLASTKNTTKSLPSVSSFTHPAPGTIRTQGPHGYNGNARDFGGSIGTPVYAVKQGTVTLVRSDGGWNGGYGNYLVISHTNGVQTLYAHLSSVSVSQGQTVAQGDVIGALGNTGKSTGPHLHFEVRGAKNPF
jgi:LysM repeat protein